MRTYLAEGYKIKNKENRTYSVVQTMGEGATCIAYYGIDEQTKSNCIIKEYYPISISLERTSEGQLKCSDEKLDKFNKGKKRFNVAVERQVELRNVENTTNQIFYVIDRFEANGTLYVIVPQHSGNTYSDNTEIGLYDRMKICKSVAEYVGNCHDEGYLCLDIKPDNIFVLPGTSELAMFFDFDSVCRMDEVAYGENLSYTNFWAAPEQVVPGSYSKISAASDIFVLGELIYWSVFDCHSAPYEYRRHSRFDYSKSQFENLLTNNAEKILTDIFHHTLRSAVNNRYSSVEELIARLNDLLEEVIKEERINSFEVFSKDFFVGRDTEIELLGEKLQEHKIIFVSGVPGIGKSEIVKKYVNQHRMDFSYVLFWFYEGDFEKMICSDYSVSISNFKREKNETDKEYSHRKLNKLRSLIDEHTLIVIDNLDLFVEEIRHSNLWNILKSFQGKMIVTSRCEQKNYETITVSEIDNDDVLVGIFNRHCPSCVGVEGEKSVVEQIIKLANRHTYEIELLAGHAEAEKKLPSELLLDMQMYGIGGFDKTEICSVKDGYDVSLTFNDHLLKIFSLNNLTDEQKKTLLKLSFLPSGGVDVRSFRTFYSIENYNDLNWLIGHGLLYETKDSRHIITIHPAVAEMTVSVLKKENSIADSFYTEALTAMRRGYVDEDVNREFLYRVYSHVKESLKDKEIIRAYNEKNLSDAEVKSRIDNLLEEFEGQYAKIDIEQDVYRSLCESLVQKSVLYQMNRETAARFLTQYVQWFMRYGHHDFLKEVILYAKKVFDSIDSTEYFQDRECMYDIYVLLLLKNEKNAERALNMSKEHLKIAISARDWEFASNWCINVAISYYYLNELVARIKYQMKGLGYLLREILFRKGKKYSNSFFADKYSRTTRSVWFSELEYDELVEYPRSSIFSLRTAINARKSKETFYEQNVSVNEIKTLMDKAKIKMLQEDFLGAKEGMDSFLVSYRKGEQGYTEATYEALSLLGEICTLMSEYEEALCYYHECLIVAKSLDYQDVHRIEAKVGRIYNLCEDFETSSKFNTKLLKELEEKNIEASEIILADAYHNVAEMHWLMRAYDESLDFLKKAETLYDKYVQGRTHCKIGKFRCLVMEARVMAENNHIEESEQLRQKGMEGLEDILGASHPEVIRLKKKLIV